MEDYIWVVVNAGGNAREKVSDKCNASACRELTERRLTDQADILAEGPYNQALQLKEGDRMAMQQGGGRKHRPWYGSGQLIAFGHIRSQARALVKQDRLEFTEQYKLTRRYFPEGKRGNKLVGIIFYSLKRAKENLPIEDLVGVRPRPGNKFIRVDSTHPAYRTLIKWWNKNALVGYRHNIEY